MVVFIPLLLGHKFGAGFGTQGEGKRQWKDHSEVLLSSLLSIHGIQNGLPFGGVALPELLYLPFHHGV